MKQAALITIITFLFAAAIALLSTQSDDSVEFEENYRINLRQGGYELYRVHDQKIIFVKNGDLEEFFLRDNM